MSLRRRRLIQVAVPLWLQGSIGQLAAGAEVMFRRVAVAKLAGTSHQSEVSAAPTELVRVFGPPTEEPWDSESLGAFYFQGQSEEVFVVYYRAYDVRRTEQLTRSFWGNATPVAFSIGAKTKARVAEFKAWFARQVE
jgi:hypothetical protein